MNAPAKHSLEAFVYVTCGKIGEPFFDKQDHRLIPVCTLQPNHEEITGKPCRWLKR